MQKHCVFREVEAAFLFIIYINLGIYGWVVPLEIHRQSKSNKMTNICLMNTNYEILMTFECIFETFLFKMYGTRHEPDGIFRLETSRKPYSRANIIETNIRQNTKPVAYQ